jgi:hypothetical protein
MAGLSHLRVETVYYNELLLAIVPSNVALGFTMRL